MYVQKRLSNAVHSKHLFQQKQNIECFICNKQFDHEFDFIKHKLLHSKKELRFNEAANVLFR